MELKGIRELKGLTMKLRNELKQSSRSIQNTLARLLGLYEKQGRCDNMNLRIGEPRTLKKKDATLGITNLHNLSYNNDDGFWYYLRARGI